MADEKNKDKEQNSEKMKALRAAMDKIEKSYGKGSIMKMGDEIVEEIPVISSGSISLNVALGVGGYPRGRVIEIYGPESSGKTTLAIHAIAEAQKAGGVAAFVDAEHAFDRFYAEKLGVKTNDLLISQPSSGEEALEIAEQRLPQIGRQRGADLELLIQWNVGAALGDYIFQLPDGVHRLCVVNTGFGIGAHGPIQIAIANGYKLHALRCAQELERNSSCHKARPHHGNTDRITTVLSFL